MNCARLGQAGRLTRKKFCLNFIQTANFGSCNQRNSRWIEPENILNADEVSYHKTRAAQQDAMVDILSKDNGLVAFLDSYISDEKKELFSKILDQRTKKITVVLEDAHFAQNASAIVRTCEGFGVQDIHAIELNRKFVLNKPICLGADKWVDVHEYTETLDAIQTIKNKGYKVVATTPHENSISIFDLKVDQPIALMLGSEDRGLSKEAISQADATVYIPMYGFTESYNLAASAAMGISHLSNRLRQPSNNVNWHLSEEEKRNIRFRWSCTLLKKNGIHNKLIKLYYEKLGTLPPVNFKPIRFNQSRLFKDKELKQIETARESLEIKI